MSRLRVKSILPTTNTCYYSPTVIYDCSRSTHFRYIDLIQSHELTIDVSSVERTSGLLVGGELGVVDSSVSEGA